MAKKTIERATPHVCSGCQGPVQVRRPSKTGEHWCPKSECQAAKQRFYRARGKLPNQDVDALQRQFISDLAHRERVTCGQCGLPNALPGWAHRSEAGSQTPCYGVGAQGRGLGGGWLDLVHPELVDSP